MYITQLVSEFEVLMKYKRIEIHLEDPVIHMISFSFKKSHFKHLIDFNKTLVVGDTEQGSEYILHLEKGDVRYHLGLKKDIELNEYVPVSFFFEKGQKMNKFIEGQKQIKIKKISRIL